MDLNYDEITFNSLVEPSSSQLFDDYMRYMRDNEVYHFRVLSKDHKKDLSINHPKLNRTQVNGLLSKLRGDNTNGRSIYIRPTDRRWLFLDLDSSPFDDPSQIPIIETQSWSFALHTSATSFQLWFYVENLDSDEQQVAVGKYLAAQYFDRYGLEFDKGAGRAGQIGRAPGFRNQKPFRNHFWTTFTRPSDNGRFSLRLPLSEIVYQYGVAAPGQKRKADAVEKPASGNNDRSRSGADFCRCMSRLRATDGHASVAQMVSTLANFSTHKPTRGETPDEYYRTTVANARLKWALGNMPLVENVFGGSYATVEGDPPPGFKYPGGRPKPSVVQ